MRDSTLIQTILLGLVNMILGALPRVTVTCVDACGTSPNSSCASNCQTFDRRSLEWKLAKLESHATTWNYVPAPLRADLVGRITSFLTGQFLRLGPDLNLHVSTASKAGFSFCGANKVITGARAIVDQSVSILLLPPNVAIPIERVIPHRVAIAQSTLRHMAEQTKQAEACLASCAETIAPHFQVHSAQILAMLTEGRPDSVMAALDPHGSLREHWRKYCERKFMERECTVAAACLERFVLDYGLAGGTGYLFNAVCEDACCG